MPAVFLLAAARPVAAQGWHETQVWGVALASRPAVYALGLGAAWRDAGRTRIGIALAGGATEHGTAAARAEATWHFLLDPGRARGLAVYGGGGLALTAVQDSTVRPFVEAVLGVETGPASRAGFFLEAGFGGGARLAMGFRWRKQNAPGR
jgi:hypothetical protein